MLMFVVRGAVLLGVLSWYSAAVWRLIDGYFKDQFHAYLQEEYRRYPRMRSDAVESDVAVDKGPPASTLPTEWSPTGETYGPDAVHPTDIADTCSRVTVAPGKHTAERVTGGGGENAAVSAGPTDKNAFPENAARSKPESRKPPSGSDTHEERRLLDAINQAGDHEEERAIEGSEIVNVGVPASPWRPGRSQGRFDRRKSTGSKEISYREKLTRRRVIILTDVDFVSARANDDFSEFEEEEEEQGAEEKEEEEKNQRVPKKGTLVSELPFKPKADIGGLDRVTTEEFCPLTLEDETSCGETTAWPR